MDNPFVRDGALLPIASLNRLPVAGRGLCAQQLCASAVILQSLRAVLAAQGYPDGADSYPQFSRLLEDPRTQAQMQPALARVADDLCALLLTLKRTGRTLPQTPWQAAHWDFWQQIDRIYLAGGMLAGTFGAQLCRRTQTQLAARGVQDLTLTLAPHPPCTALLGAARVAAQAGSRSALVFDFGHSYLKQGYFCAENGQNRLYTLPQVPARYMDVDAPPAHAHALAAFLADTAAACWRQVCAAGGQPDGTLAVSIANYVDHGRLAARSGYGKLTRVDAQFDRWLAHAVSRRVGHPVHVRLLHDGMAGACAVQTAHWPHEAFIGLGTSLSVGFPCAGLDAPFACAVQPLG